MMSKEDFNSDELDTLRRSRNPTVVLTFNGEVRTNEEAQVFVHDLNLFVTVQCLEETPAVLSRGKLCEDHRCSYEWVSGQKTRVTKEKKAIFCKTVNFVPLVVPGLSTSSGSNSSSTSTLQDLSSTSPAQERSDGLAPCGSPSITENKIKKRDGNRDSDDRFRDLPAWWEEFTDNLEDTRVHAQTHFSRDSDSDRTTKVVTKSRKHSIESHFPKGLAKSACEPKGQGPLAKDVETLLRAEKFGDFITANHKVLNEGCEERINDTLSLFKILPLNGTNPIRAKQRLHKRRDGVFRKFLESSQKPIVI